MHRDRHRRKRPLTPTYPTPRPIPAPWWADRLDLIQAVCPWRSSELYLRCQGCGADIFAQQLLWKIQLAPGLQLTLCHPCGLSTAFAAGFYTPTEALELLGHVPPHGKDGHTDTARPIRTLPGPYSRELTA